MDPSPLPPTTTPPGSDRETDAPTRLGVDDLDEVLLEFPVGIRLNVRPESPLELDDELELEPLELPSEELLDPDELLPPEEDEPDDPDDVLPPRGMAWAPAVAGTASATAIPNTNVRLVDLRMIALPRSGCGTSPLANGATLLPLTGVRNCLTLDPGPF
jgi:hypothetical protein